MASINNFKTQKTKDSKGCNIFKQRKSKNKKTDNLTKSERLMNGVALWCSYYRYFPHVFVEEYLGVQLKTFQKILIYFMMHYHYQHR